MLSTRRSPALTIAEHFDRSENNFHVLRLLAATVVLFNHSFALAGAGPSPIRRLYELAGRSLAVDVFFIASGFLLSRSFERRARPLPFLHDRVLRIYPALIVNAVASAFIIGPLFTTLEPASYFASPQVYLYIVRSLALIDVQYELPGVFADLPSSAVNGSLWVVLHFVALYGVVATIGSAGGYRNPRRFALFLVAGTAFYALFEGGHGPFQLPGKIDRLRELSIVFLLASAAWVWRDRIRVSLPLLVALLCGAVVARLVLPDQLAALAFAAAEVYTVLFLAFVPCAWLGPARLLGECSYGIFLYGFPIQQSLLASAQGFAPLSLFIATTAITLPFAALSWYGIEQPVTSWRRRRDRRASDATRLHPPPGGDLVSEH